MAKEKRSKLKTYFETGDLPTHGNFIDLIDSEWNQADDGIEKTGRGLRVVTKNEEEAKPLLSLDQQAERIGIGTDTPAAPLHIKGDGPVLGLEGTNQTGVQFFTNGYKNGRTGWIGFGSGTNTDLEIKNEKAGSILKISTKDTSSRQIPVIGIAADGNLGLRTLTPKGALQIGYRWVFHNGGSNGLKFIAQNNYYENRKYQKITEGAAIQLRFETNGSLSIQKGRDNEKGSGETPAFTLGNLKVGAAAISGGIDLAVFGSNLFVDSDLSNRNNGVPEQILKTNPGTGVYSAMIASSGILSFYTRNKPPIPNVPFEKVEGSETLRLLINEKGCVGVGEPDPQAKLHVKGSVLGKGMLLFYAYGTTSDNNNTFLVKLDGSFREHSKMFKTAVYLPKGINKISGRITYRVHFTDRTALPRNLEIKLILNSKSLYAQAYDFSANESYQENFVSESEWINEGGNWHELEIDISIKNSVFFLEEIMLYVEE